MASQSRGRESIIYDEDAITKETNVGNTPVSTPYVILFFIYNYLVFAILIFGVLLSIISKGVIIILVDIPLFGWINNQLRVYNLASLEYRTLTGLMICAAFGGQFHTMRSFGWYVGNRELYWSWIPIYLFRPLVGMGLGLVFYIVMRGGHFAPVPLKTQDGVEQIPFGVYAIGLFAGLFSDQAMEKLKNLADMFFNPAPKGKNTVPTDGSVAKPEVLPPTPERSITKPNGKTTPTPLPKPPSGRESIAVINVVGRDEYVEESDFEQPSTISDSRENLSRTRPSNTTTLFPQIERSAPKRDPGD